MFMINFAPMNEIRIDNVTIGYPHKIVAEGLSNKFYGGSLTCLIGRNGLGKSTLLKVLAGFMPPLSGHIVICYNDKEYDISVVSKKELSRLVSVVLTGSVDIANITARNVVAMGRIPYTNFFGKLGKEDEQIITKALQITDAAPLADRDINTLSDGERQKIMIARAVAQQTPIILLDEPTAFLDYPSKVHAMRLLQSLAHDTGRVILASTHDLDIALHTADRLITIDNGIKEVGRDRLRSMLQTEKFIR